MYSCSVFKFRDGKSGIIKGIYNDLHLKVQINGPCGHNLKRERRNRTFKDSCGVSPSQRKVW